MALSSYLVFLNCVDIGEMIKFVFMVLLPIIYIM